MPEDTLNIDYHIKRLFLKALNKYRSKIEIYQALGISRTRYNNLCELPRSKLTGHPEGSPSSQGSRF